MLKGFKRLKVIGFARRWCITLKSSCEFTLKIRMIEKDVQKRILKAIKDSGGIANTREISDITNLSILKINSAVRHLQSRYLVKKIKPEKQFPKLPDSYELINNQFDRINQLISEIC